jgi:hypothetical protein
VIRARYATLVLALFAIAAAPANRPTGFIALSRLVAAHPLHVVLLEYDREIAALRSTQTLPGLRDAAATTANAAAAQRRDATAGRAVVERINARGGNVDLSRERAALATLAASRNATEDAMNSYAGALARETGASISAYQSATLQRSRRAYAARAQQLREKELTLAFDLERADAGERLKLELKLDDLHLTPSRRATLKAALATLDQRELQAVTAQRRHDAAILASYGQRLQDEGTGASAQMAAQLHAKAAANFAVRTRVLQAQSSAAEPIANLRSRISAFSGTYRRPADSAAIDSGLKMASGDLSHSFDELAAADRQSQRDTTAQIAALEAGRSALYNVIVAQILRAAQRIAAERRLANVDFAGAPPPHSIDITAAVKAALTR